MKTGKSARLAGAVAAGSLALAIPFLVSAQSAPESQGDASRSRTHMMKTHGDYGHDRGHHGYGSGRGMHDGERGMRGGMRGGERGMRGEHGMGMGMGGMGMGGMGAGLFLRGLDLTDEQRDRIFAIRHASAPAMREQAKALRSTHGEFAELALATEYDEAKVKELADRTAQAISAMAQLRTRTINEIYRVLTPEQQTQVKERKARWEQRGARGEGAQRGEGRRGMPRMESQPATPRS